MSAAAANDERIPMNDRFYRYIIYRLSAPTGAFIEEPANISARDSEHAAEQFFSLDPNAETIIVRAALDTPGYSVQRVYVNENRPRIVNPYATSA